MKNFLDLCRTRCSVRKYLPDPVPEEKLLKCLEAARLAPSAENLQPWQYLVINKEPLLTGVKETASGGIFFHTRWIRTAPVVIALLARTNLAVRLIGPVIKKLDYYLIDLGIATEHLVLEAADLGLGTCWVGWFNEKACAKLLQIPSGYRLAGLLALGYPARGLKVALKKRKRMEERVWFNKVP